MNRRGEHPIKDVRDAACKVMSLSVGEAISRERSPAYLGPARVAIAGAMKELSDHDPALQEIADAFGKRHHSTVQAWVTRYNRCWPPALRRIWVDAVEQELAKDQT